MPATDPGATGDPAWDARCAAVWSRIDELEPEAFRAEVEELVAGLGSGSGLAAFERAAAADSTGEPEWAVPLYGQALALGLPGERRRRAKIQLASSLRNLDQPQAAVDLLEEELRQPSDHLDAAVRAFLALALADCGRTDEALAHALTGLAPLLPRYQRSVAAYAEDFYS